MGYTRGYQSVGVGDPFIHSKIGSALRGVGGFLPGPLGAIAGAVGRTGFFQPTSTLIQQTVPQPMAFPGGFTGVRGLQETTTSGTRGKGGTATSTALVVQGKKRRRMNPLNVKALRRSTRRLAAFQREAKKVEKELRKLAPPARRRSSKQDLGVHHTHVR